MCMYICMCVYVCIYMCICMYIWACIMCIHIVREYLYEGTYVYIFACISVYMCVCVCKYVSMYVDACINIACVHGRYVYRFIYIYVYKYLFLMSICLCICMCEYMYVNVCMLFFITEWMSSILYKGEVFISISLLLPPFSNQVVEWCTLSYKNKQTITWFIVKFAICQSLRFTCFT